MRSPWWCLMPYPGIVLPALIAFTITQTANQEVPVDPDVANGSLLSTASR